MADDVTISVGIDSQGAETGARRVNGALRQTDQHSQQAHRSVGRLEQGMGGLRRAAMMAGGALTAYFSVRAITQFTSSAISQFSDLETVMWRIEKQAEQMGHAWADTEYITDFSREIGRATLGSAQEVREATQVLLTQQNLTQESYEETIIAAQSLSEVTGVAMPTAIRYFTRGMSDASGTTNMFARYIGDLDESTKDQIESLQEAGDELAAYDVLLAAVTARLPDATEGGETLAHKTDSLSEAMGRLREEIGEGLAPVVGDIVEDFTAWVEANDDLIAQNVAEWADRTATALGGIKSTYDGVPDYIKGPAGVGLVGAIIFGAKPALVAAMLMQIEQGLKAIDENIDGIEMPRSGGIIDDFHRLNELISGSGEILGEIASGQRDFWTGEKTGADQTFAGWESVNRQLADYKKGAEDAADQTDKVNDAAERLARTLTAAFDKPADMPAVVTPDDIRDAERIYDRTRTSLENLNKEMTRYNELLALGEIDLNTYARAVGQAYEKVTDEVKDANEHMVDGMEDAARRAANYMNDAADDTSDAWKHAMERVQDHIADAIAANLRGVGDLRDAIRGLGDLTANIAGEFASAGILGEMGKSDGLFGSLFENVAKDSLFGSLISGIGGGILSGAAGGLLDKALGFGSGPSFTEAFQPVVDELRKNTEALQERTKTLLDETPEEKFFSELAPELEKLSREGRGPAGGGHIEQIERRHREAAIREGWFNVTTGEQFVGTPSPQEIEGYERREISRNEEALKQLDEFSQEWDALLEAHKGHDITAARDSIHDMISFVKEDFLSGPGSIGDIADQTVEVLELMLEQYEGYLKESGRRVLGPAIDKSLEEAMQTLDTATFGEVLRDSITDQLRQTAMEIARDQILADLSDDLLMDVGGQEGLVRGWLAGDITDSQVEEYIESLGEAAEKAAPLLEKLFGGIWGVGDALDPSGVLESMDVELRKFTGELSGLDLEIFNITNRAESYEQALIDNGMAVESARRKTENWTDAMIAHAEQAEANLKLEDQRREVESVEQQYMQAIQDSINVKYDEIDAYRQATDDAQADYLAGLRDEISLKQEQAREYEQTAEQMRRFGDSIRDFHASLLTGRGSPLGIAGQRDFALSQFQQMAQAAMGGDESAIGGITGVARELMSASQRAGIDDTATIQAALNAIERETGQQVSEAERQARQLDRQIDQQQEIIDQLQGYEEQSLEALRKAYEQAQSHGSEQIAALEDQIGKQESLLEGLDAYEDKSLSQLREIWETEKAQLTALERIAGQASEVVTYKPLADSFAENWDREPSYGPRMSFAGGGTISGPASGYTVPTTFHGTEHITPDSQMAGVRKELAEIKNLLVQVRDTGGDMNGTGKKAYRLLDRVTQGKDYIRIQEVT